MAFDHKNTACDVCDYFRATPDHDLRGRAVHLCKLCASAAGSLQKQEHWPSNRGVGCLHLSALALDHWAVVPRGDLVGEKWRRRIDRRVMDGALRKACDCRVCAGGSLVADFDDTIYEGADFVIFSDFLEPGEMEHFVSEMERIADQVHESDKGLTGGLRIETLKKEGSAGKAQAESLIDENREATQRGPVGLLSSTAMPGGPRLSETSDELKRAQAYWAARAASDD